jgi:hypothetical protein
LGLNVRPPQPAFCDPPRPDAAGMPAFEQREGWGNRTQWPRDVRAKSGQPDFGSGLAGCVLIPSVGGRSFAALGPSTLGEDKPAAVFRVPNGVERGS